MTAVSDFDYELPKELIALYPTKERTQSRLLHINKESQSIAHRQFTDITQLLQPNDLLVINDSKVIAARLFGHKPSGGKIEILIERILDTKHALAHVRSNKPLKPNAQIHIDQSNAVVTLLSKQDSLFHLQFDHVDSVLELTKAVGHMPLPPYIERSDDKTDLTRYQTVYAHHDGSVAAPTAGLHFDTDTLAAIRKKGVAIETLTLHVGAGTFQPVRVDKIEAHIMHSEWIEVPGSTCDAIHACKARGGRVIAVGTTSVRSLETAAKTGELTPFSGETDIFIFPSYQFKVVDAMITNFHLPKSTLIMLISAFAGKEFVFKAYQEAINERYRFFSYGDAMLVE
jgi:S-adenosylmethionine:tRNA ribosyltransferase-isomerase